MPLVIDTQAWAVLTEGRLSGVPTSIGLGGLPLFIAGLLPRRLQLSRREREPDRFPLPFLAISIC